LQKGRLFFGAAFCIYKKDKEKDMTTYKRMKAMDREVYYSVYENLPLIDVEGKDKKAITKEIMDTIKKCLSKGRGVGEMKTDKDSDTDKLYLHVGYTDGVKNYVITVTFDRPRWRVDCCLTYRQIPQDKLRDIYELINMLNDGSRLGTFRVLLDENMIVIETGMDVTRYFNSQELFMRLKQMKNRALIHFPFIDELIDTDQDVRSFIKQISEDFQESLKVY
jgi:hypothetical protein